ncbi:hypothetical protein CGT99_14715 [Vibrio metoecus]|nr:hypothetical protein CGT99_14715 [Vibrio metoecus]
MVVLREVLISRSAIYRKMNDGEFPQSVSLGERAIAWVESEVDEWMSGWKCVWSCANQITRKCLIGDVKKALLEEVAAQ